MRSPVIAFSILAAAVSPSLVAGAPTSPNLENALARDNAIAHTQDFSTHHVRDVSGVLPIPGQTPPPSTGNDGAGGPGGKPGKGNPAPSGNAGALVGGLTSDKEPDTSSANVETPQSRTEAMRKAKAQMDQPSTDAITSAPKAGDPKAAAAKMSKRAQDQYTAGGNSYSGAAQDSSGGDVYNEAQGGDNGDGAAGITNADGSNAAGGAGSSFSGFSFGGNGNGRGPGGNAYSGATGASRGGNVVNTSEGGGGAGATGSDIDNTTANTAGGGGFSESGSAEGGDAARPRLPANAPGVQRRASDSGTAGGNAYSGATNDVSGGSVVNEADDRGTVTNDGGNTAGGAGTTFSGDADGGNGNGFGPGGNAYSGASGPAVGGSVYNSGGAIDNAADSNAAGGGGISETGDATGGRA